ncbi:MAG TPA: cyclopropane-fatty-acyl-phospholipid synthase family protein [Polyangiaceae bacterium]|nr:cyclopropane-fatty-acyl-phospholipid synthase family protein [Polyangiaceae bacterium]
MSNVITAPANDKDSGADATRRASEHTEAGRSHWLSVIFWLLEQRWPTLLAIPTTFAALAYAVSGNALVAAGTWLAVPLLGIGIPVVLIVVKSHGHDRGAVDWTPYVSFRDPSEAARWSGKKIPMEIVYEAYIAERLDFRGDVYETMLLRNQLFRFCFTWGDAKFYLANFLRQNLGHTLAADRNDVAPNYDRGNDFYGAFLGETMVYTSGIFLDESETLEAGQRRKLETVCQYVQMKPGDRHLDIGCGWGTLVAHAAKEHGTYSTGITLAKEQAAWAKEVAAAAGVSDRVKLIVDDYRNLPKAKYDKITCLEMAEHVGIRNFQAFLLQVRSMLEDDGIFYLQIAGLRREWQYEDLVWGLFMGKHVFPGADASCPLAFVVSQVERAGFEVHRVENCGAHYSVTIHKWYENWLRNRDAVVEKYGERWFRAWAMFLGWSTLIGAQGSSTVFMITLTKNIENDRSSVGEAEARGVAFSRKERWIGSRPIATQQ